MRLASWERQALCQYFHNDLWFPPIFPEERNGVSSKAYTDIAKLVCAECPARRTCELEGRKEENLHKHAGVWGGLTAEERMKGKDWIKDGMAPKKRLPPEYRYLIPEHDPTSPLDVVALKQSLKSVLTKRV